MDAHIQEKLNQLPTTPGVYLMKNSDGKIIYVGKALNLKNRVRSYFRAQPKEAVKTKALVRHITDFEYIIVDNETEALILECNLIKKHRPKYNINLKDGKTYPYVRITADDYPKVFITRHVVRDGSRYFGPYPNVYQLRETLELLHRIYPYRTCSDSRFHQGNACLNAHINLCAAPCVDRISAEDYQAMIERIADFFGGHTEALERQLKAQMQAASDAQAYESAALYRDQLFAVQHLNSEQKAILAGNNDEDIIAMARNDIGAVVQIFFVRSGKILGRESYPMDVDATSTDDDIFNSFLKQFYMNQESVPPTIVIDRPVADEKVLSEYLSNRHGRRTRLLVPKRGTRLDLLQMVAENAKDMLVKRHLSEERQKERSIGALADLAAFLELPAPPQRIECYDISNTQGTNSVASMVVFIDGKPDKKQYRRFRIKTVEGANDFASMNEVLHRRFAHAKKDLEEGRDSDGFGWLPDMVLIDGGKGQLAFASQALHEEGFEQIPIFSLAKREEEIFRSDDPVSILLPRESNALYLVQRIRDESHRFAITYHRSLRGKKQLASILDDIPGVGKKRKEALLTHFGSFSKIRCAESADLAEVPGISQKTAQDIYDYLRTHEDLQARTNAHQSKRSL